MESGCKDLCKAVSTIFMVFIIFSLVLMGCATGGGGVVDKEPSGVFVSGGMIHSKGYGVSRKGDLPGSRMLTAREAAYTIALGNLLEYIKGVQIDSRTTVKNGALDKQEVQKATEGLVKNVVILKEGLVQKTGRRVIYFVELGMKNEK